MFTHFYTVAVHSINPFARQERARVEERDVSWLREESAGPEASACKNLPPPFVQLCSCHICFHQHSTHQSTARNYQETLATSHLDHAPISPSNPIEHLWSKSYMICWVLMQSLTGSTDQTRCIPNLAAPRTNCTTAWNLSSVGEFRVECTFGQTATEECVCMENRMESAC